LNAIDRAGGTGQSEEGAARLTLCRPPGVAMSHADAAPARTAQDASRQEFVGLGPDKLLMQNRRRKKCRKE